MNDRVGHGPFAKAAGLLEDLAGVHLTVKRVERAAEAERRRQGYADGDRAKAITARTLVPLPPSPLPDKLYAAIDGTGVPVTAREAAGRLARARTAAPAPARSSSPSSSPRTCSTTTVTRSATGTPRPTSPRSSPPAHSRTSWRPRASAAARATSAR